MLLISCLSQHTNVKLHPFSQHLVCSPRQSRCVLQGRHSCSFTRSHCCRNSFRSSPPSPLHGPTTFIQLLPIEQIQLAQEWCPPPHYLYARQLRQENCSIVDYRYSIAQQIWRFFSVLITYTDVPLPRPGQAHSPPRFYMVDNFSYFV